MLSSYSKRVFLCEQNGWRIIQTRQMSKRTKHSSITTKDPTELALAHFDKFYRPVFQNNWPSIRLALLSPQKYCALVNNYAETQETIANLISEGASNICTIAKDTTVAQRHTAKVSETSHEQIEENASNRDSNKQDSQNTVCDNQTETGQTELSTDLYDFMPTKRIGSEVERMKHAEMEQNMEYRTENIENVKFIHDGELNFPFHLKAFAFEREDPSAFPHPKTDASGKMDCYMYDAASLLPVLALDLQLDNNVLDLCAAPGGKALTIMQTLLPSHITCVDLSYSRVKRLREIIKNYTPGKHAIGDQVSVVCKDGVKFCSTLDGDGQFDRVLVDAPCYADRHVLKDPDNNLFRPGRLEERLRLPKLQQQLLFGAITACRPNGIVVYSTCTLSPVQNDGVIQATLEKIWQETKIDMAVVDTSHMVERFKEIYNFNNKTRFGQLVIPNTTANFGPMYFCKLKRLG